MARTVQKSLRTNTKREDEELACAAGLEVKKAPALRRNADSDYEDRQFLLPIRAYGLASTNAMRDVTVGCDAKPLLAE